MKSLKFSKSQQIKHQPFEDQGSYKSVKVSHKKKKIEKVSTWKKKAWNQFSIFIRSRDALLTTGRLESVKCFTCDKEYPAFGKGCVQAGHFISGRHPSILFEPTGCHAQCYNCNINLKGNGLKYYRKMEKMYGNKVIKALEKRNEEISQLKVEDYKEIYLQYKRMNEIYWEDPNGLDIDNNLE